VWEKADIASMKLDLRKLAEIDSAMQAAHANGILIMDGKVVREWNYDGPSDKKLETQSITKTIVSLLLGIAIQEGKISSIDAKVADYYPKFDVGPYTKEITFKHLVTTSSGIASNKYGYNYSNPNNMKPGVDARYHNDHFDQLAIALTYVYKEPLENVFQSRVLSRIGGTVEWRTDGEVALEDGRAIPVNAGYAFTKWNAADLARVGWLYLNNGYWNGERIVDSKYVADSRKPLDIPVMISRGNHPVVPDQNSTYGYGWRGLWMNDRKDVFWYMSGNGGQFCAVVPEHRLVFVKINGYSDSYKPYRGASVFKDRLLGLRPSSNGK